jgi:lipoprotein-anchoring transpeptidase ErfK/SrfK
VPAPPRGARPAFPSARSGGIALAAGAVVLILAGATFLWLKRSPGAVDHPSNPETPAATVAERFAAPPVTAPPPPENRDASVKDSSARSQLSYVYRRQSVFYRTTEPAGTVIIDKPQHFLYVVEPNNVAIRYGIGVGDVCVDIGGLLRVSNKTEWPAWSPSNEGIKQERQPVKVIAGGVDNPLGARALYMGDDAHSIHGTNAPESVGGSIPYGCIGLANDQVIDLYGRIPVGTKVVARN